MSNPHRSPAQVHRRRLASRFLLFTLVALALVQLGVWGRRFLGSEGARFVTQVAYSPDGETLVWASEGDGGEGTLYFWDIRRKRTRLVVRARDLDPDATSKAASAFTSLAYMSEGRVVAALRSNPGSDPRVVLLDAASGRVMMTLRGHFEAIIALAVSPDGKTLATASRDRSLKLWEVATGKPFATLSVGRVPLTSIAFSTDGLTLATGWGDGSIRLRQPRGENWSAVWNDRSAGVTCLAYSPDGRNLAAAGTDGSLRLIDAATGAEIKSRSGLPNVCRSIAFSTDGALLAIKFAETSVGGLWNVAEWRLSATFEHASGALAFDPVGKTLAVAGGGIGRVDLVAVPAGLIEDINRNQR